MVGSPELVEGVMDYLAENEDVGFFFPENLQVIKEHVEWGPNSPLIHSLLERADLPKVEIPKIAEICRWLNGVVSHFCVSVLG